MAKSTVREFSEHLVPYLREASGMPIERKLAWYLFQTIFEAILEYVMEEPIDDKGEQRLSLRGIGTFVISWHDPVQVKGRHSPLMQALLDAGKQVPRFRWSPSAKIKDHVIETLTGFDRDGRRVSADSE